MENELKQLIRHIRAYIFPNEFKADATREVEAIKEYLTPLLTPFTNNATSVLENFIQQLPKLKTLIHSDAEAIRRNDPSVESLREIVYCYPGLRVMLYFRTAHQLYELSVPTLPRYITEAAHSITGIDIHPAATIGDHFCIDHGTGIVIGATAIIGNGVTLYQGVTLGAKNFQYDAEGLPLDIPRHPILEDNVTIYSNTSILGRIRIGEGTVIGGNVWLTHDIPPHSRVLQGQFVKEC